MLRRRKILWDRASYKEEQEPVSQPAPVVSESTSTTNNKKKRSLTNEEKDKLSQRFKDLNGITSKDICTQLKQELGDVTINQVKGFFTYLHNKVQKGYIKLYNPVEYNGWLISQGKPELDPIPWRDPPLGTMPDILPEEQSAYDELPRFVAFKRGYFK